MARLPSSADVQTVSPQSLADPGVQIPAGATQTTLGIAAQELAPAAQALAGVAVRQQNRRDTVDRSSRINLYNREADELLRNTNVKEDLSDDQVLSTYAGKLQQRRQELLSEHQGSEDSRAALATRLNDVESAFIGRAAALSTSLGREKVLTTFDDALTPLVDRAATNPTRDTIDQLFVDLKTQIDDLSGALVDATEEEKLRSFGREQIALASLNSLVNRGHFETAEALLDQGGLVNALSPQSVRDVRGRLETTRATRDKLLNEILQAQQILGRPLTESELMDKLGITPTDRQKEIDDLIERGVSPPLAKDIGNGNVRVVGPDNLGDFFSVNIVTNKSTKIVGADAEKISSMVGIAGQQTQQPGEPGQPAQPGQPGQPAQPSPEGQAAQPGAKTEPQAPSAIEQAVGKGTGPFAKMQAGISNVIGPFLIGKTIFEDTTDARQQVRIFSQIAKTRLINNPKFPVAEQKIVQGLMPDVDQFFKDPDTARSDLQEMENYLVGSRDAKEGELDSKITSKRRGELFDQISAINELLTIMKAPGEPEGGPPAFSTQEEVDKLDPGTRFFWEPTGEELIKD